MSDISYIYYYNIITQQIKKPTLQFLREWVGLEAQVDEAYVSGMALPRHFAFEGAFVSPCYHPQSA